MDVNLDDLRRHYSSLSDDALQAINPDDLTAAARDCLNQELANRGLNLKDNAAPEEEQESSAKTPDFVEAATFHSYSEGSLARAVLRSAEIPAFLDEQRSGLGTLKLWVPPDFLEQAQEILETPLSEEELAAQAEAAAPPGDAEDSGDQESEEEEQ
jgi:hypothetical protein